MKKIDLTGKRFGRLVVIKQYGHIGKAISWLTKCDCGQQKVIHGTSLKKGYTNSCGCLRKEVTSTNKRKHGMTKTKTYQTWNGIKKRCFNKKSLDYSRYGGIGITVCNGFMNFSIFYELLSDPPTKKHMIDRIDNNGNYSCGQCQQCIENKWPFNCRWVTNKEQQNNKRTNHYITYKGITKTLSQFAEEFSISAPTLSARIRIHKWPIEKALETPVIVFDKDILFNGITDTIGGWSRRTGIPDSTLSYRLLVGWPTEKALTIKPSHANQGLFNPHDLNRRKK